MVLPNDVSGVRIFTVGSTFCNPLPIPSFRGILSALDIARGMVEIVLTEAGLVGAFMLGLLHSDHSSLFKLFMSIHFRISMNAT